MTPENTLVLLPVSLITIVSESEPSRVTIEISVASTAMLSTLRASSMTLNCRTPDENATFSCVEATLHAQPQSLLNGEMVLETPAAEQEQLCAAHVTVMFDPCEAPKWMT